MVPFRHHSTARTAHNFFELLGVPTRFEIDTTDLASRYKALQRKWHPDKYAQADHAAQSTALDMSSRLNEAYLVLRTPHRRAEHLLTISRKDSYAFDDEHVEPEFLTWVMTFRERIDEAAANPVALRALRSEAEEAMSECLALLSKAFKENQFDVAAHQTARLKYFRRIMYALDRDDVTTQQA